jgi:hypothetical protein
MNLSEQSILQTDSISYLGTNISSSSDSQSPMARFFPPEALTGEEVRGGVISML